MNIIILTDILIDILYNHREKVVYDNATLFKLRNNKIVELDERLMTTPAIALERCRVLTQSMAHVSMNALKNSLTILDTYDAEMAQQIRDDETAADHYEDILGSYLVKLNTFPMNDKDSNESSKLLFVIGDFERISDHAVNILESAEEIRTKGIDLSDAAKQELKVIIGAVDESVNFALEAFCEGNLEAAAKIEPLEQVIDLLKSQLRSRHIVRMQKGNCSIEAGFIWSDLLTNLERVSDHCSNIAGCIIEMAHESMDLHEYLQKIKQENPEFTKMYDVYLEKYAITSI